MATTAYPFDPTGVAATNKIVGEQHIITAPNYRDFHFVVPTYAPFFAQGLVVKHRDANNVVRTLVEGIDYYTTHWFISASRGCARPIYGSISFLDLTLTGVIILDYQTLGGIWTQTPAKVAEILADIVHNPRITAFEQVIDMVVSFPVIDHEWDLADMVGMTEVVAALVEIEDALRETGAGGITDHIADTSNPHATTKAQVGLGSVQNYPVADAPTTIAGTSAAHYVTPFGVKSAMDAGPTAAINTHVGRLDNPHATTAAQVGAYTQAQTNTLLGQKLATNGVAFDTARFDNKTPTEYRDWVLLGTAANSLKFNGFTYGEAKADILLGTAANSEEFGGMTVQEFKDSLATEGIGNASTFNGYTYAQAKADILSGTAANAVLFDGTTKADLITQARNGTVSNSNEVYGLDQQELIDLMRDEVGGWEPITAEQVTHEAQTGATANPNRWTHIASIPALVTTSLDVANAAYLVTGGTQRTAAQNDTDFVDAAYLLHVQLRRNNGVNSSEVYGVTHAMRLTAINTGIEFGVVQTGDVIDVWMKTPPLYKSFAVTQLIKGVDTTTDIDSPASVVDTAPAGIRYGNAAAVAQAGDLAQLRTDVEQSLQAITTAFNDLKTQIESA